MSYKTRYGHEPKLKELKQSMKKFMKDRSAEFETEADVHDSAFEMVDGFVAYNFSDSELFELASENPELQNVKSRENETVKEAIQRKLFRELEKTAYQQGMKDLNRNKTDKVS